MFEDLKYMYDNDYEFIDFYYIVKSVVNGSITKEEFKKITGKEFSYTMI